MSLRRLAAFFSAVALVCFACRDQGPDANACQQTYGFGNYGCADLEGVVLGAGDAPLANATVIAGGSTDPYEHIDTTTDANGHFRIRLLRRWVAPHPDYDTVTTWIHASVTTPAPDQDSVFATIPFSRLLRTPKTTTVTIHVVP